ncbi:hypothetical protein BU25DRAFT_469590 [Macroventuria anomochaeta]|uniref:Uncharacterized protein n=1 Tax=Macroventuria anomochaeta TaxID=301207 RepID=A0ACB6RZF1_9PLEO|nr:uncharacterized protein BU25DRAFT_469590 [Macroventuria anomochaeta]KAF2627153.1 hypothetical protein BU25DRAFT_469590 [Macroventuria anomochaeta]
MSRMFQLYKRLSSEYRTNETGGSLGHHFDKARPNRNNLSTLCRYYFLAEKYPGKDGGGPNLGQRLHSCLKYATPNGQASNTVHAPQQTVKVPTELLALETSRAESEDQRGKIVKQSLDYEEDRDARVEKKDDFRKLKEDVQVQMEVLQIDMEGSRNSSTSKSQSAISLSIRWTKNWPYLSNNWIFGSTGCEPNTFRGAVSFMRSQLRLAQEHAARACRKGQRACKDEFRKTEIP